MGNSVIRELMGWQLVVLSGRPCTGKGVTGRWKVHSVQCPTGAVRAPEQRGNNYYAFLLSPSILCWVL
jgi:hypothetical protein